MTIRTSVEPRLSKGVSALALLVLQGLPLTMSARPPKVANPAATSVSSISLVPLPQTAKAKPRLRLIREVASKFSGMASWYGHALQGHRTASGERFDMNELTACHRTLPFGTRVRVTNLRNRESVVVRITDRGVLNADRVIDLSAAAADKIGMLRSGIAPVRLSLEPAG